MDWMRSTQTLIKYSTDFLLPSWYKRPKLWLVKTYIGSRGKLNAWLDRTRKVAVFSVLQTNKTHFNWRETKIWRICIAFTLLHGIRMIKLISLKTEMPLASSRLWWLLYCWQWSSILYWHHRKRFSFSPNSPKQECHMPEESWNSMLP